MINHGNPLFGYFDLIFDAEKNVTLHQNGVSRWEPLKGKGFFEQTAMVHQPEYLPNGVNGYPSLGFWGAQYMHARGIAGLKGSHELLVVMRPHGGTLLDCQSGVNLQTEGGAGWELYDYITDTSTPINGSLVLGANYHGDSKFMIGVIAWIGYRNGVLPPRQRQFVHYHLRERFGLCESPSPSDSTTDKLLNLLFTP